MKAWKVNVKDDFCSVVVFAPTRGIAKSVALSSDILPDPEYLFLEAIRYPIADSQYNGNGEPCCMYWDDPDDRLFLVKECGWTCEEFMLECCEKCSAKDYCGDYQQWLDDKEDDNNE